MTRRCSTFCSPSRAVCSPSRLSAHPCRRADYAPRPGTETTFCFVPEHRHQRSRARLPSPESSQCLQFATLAVSSILGRSVYCPPECVTSNTEFGDRPKACSGVNWCRRAIYTVSGDIEIAGDDFSPGRLLVLTPGDRITVRGKTN